MERALTSSEHVDCLGGVGLGTCDSVSMHAQRRRVVVVLTDGANDRSAAELSLGLVLSVELRQPFDSGPARVKVGESVSHCDVCVPVWSDGDVVATRKAGCNVKVDVSRELVC